MAIDHRRMEFGIQSRWRLKLRYFGLSAISLGSQAIKFSCGIAQCGARITSTVNPFAPAAPGLAASVRSTTIEGLSPDMIP